MIFREGETQEEVNSDYSKAWPTVETNNMTNGNKMSNWTPAGPVETAAEGRTLFLNFLMRHGRQDIVSTLCSLTDEIVVGGLWEIPTSGGTAGGSLDGEAKAVVEKNLGKGADVQIYGGDLSKMVVVRLKEGGGERGYGLVTLPTMDFNGENRYVLRIFSQFNGREHDGAVGAAAELIYRSRDVQLQAKPDSKYYLAKKSHYYAGEHWDPSPGVAAKETFFPDGGIASREFLVNGRPRGGDEPTTTEYYPGGKVKYEGWFDRKGLAHRDDGPAGVTYGEDGSIKKAAYWEHGVRRKVVRGARARALPRPGVERQKGRARGAEPLL